MTPTSVRYALARRLAGILAALLLTTFLPGTGLAQGPDWECEDLGLCKRSDGTCGVEVDGVCETIERATCLQTGCGCFRSDGSCGCLVDSQCLTFDQAACLQTGCGCLLGDGSCGCGYNGSCYPFAQGACLLSGGEWKNGTCSTGIPEPATLLLVAGGLGLVGVSVGRWRRRPRS